MKTILLVALMAISVPAFSRQYIQCGDSDSWDRAVVNLNGDESTLFMTTGVHDPDELRILKDLNFDSETATEVIYRTNDGPVVEYVSIPLEAIGVYSNYLVVTISHTNTSSGYTQSRQMSCFSAIYND